MQLVSAKNDFLDYSKMMEYAKFISSSDLIPKDFKGKPESIVVAIQMGREIGLHPLQSLQNICVINGRPSIWGDSMLALVLSHPEFEDIHEYFEEISKTAYCILKRKNKTQVTGKFSEEDARRAALWGKAGPWTNYPNRMLQLRARGFAIRDCFADALKGLITTEEARDIPVLKVVEKEVPQNISKTEQIKAKLGILNKTEEPETVIAEKSCENNKENYFMEIEEIIKNADTMENLNAIINDIREKATLWPEEEKAKLKKLIGSKKAGFIAEQAKC